MESLPKSFYCLLFVGMVVNFCFAILTASTLLRMLHLAKHMPNQVLFMPQMLRHASAESASGTLVLVLSLIGCVFGAYVSSLSDRLGRKVSCKVCLAALTAAMLLTAWPFTYILGQTASVLMVSAGFPISAAFFTSQFEGERLTQKLTVYYYAAQNFAFVLGAGVAGVQPFWLGYVEGAVLCVLSLAVVLVFSDSLKDSKEEQATAAGCDEEPCRWGDVRVRGYAVLCFFTLLFMAIFMQFLGGPFMVFAKEETAPFGSFRVPAQWYLALNGLADLIMGIPLGWVYDRLDFRFHAKFRVCFVVYAVACGLLAVAARTAPPGGVSPLFLIVAIVLISVGELHYNPIMIAAIRTEMPSSSVGLFTGIHYMLGGVGNGLAGVGMPAYAAIGSATFFIVLFAVAVVGAVGLQLISPWLVRCFEEESKGERKSLLYDSRVEGA